MPARAVDFAISYAGLSDAKVSESQLGFLCKQLSTLIKTPSIFGPSMADEIICQKAHQPAEGELSGANMRLHLEFEQNIWSISLGLNDTSTAANDSKATFHKVSEIQMRHSKKLVKLFTKKSSLKYVIHRLLYKSPLAAKMDYKGQKNITTPASKKILFAKELYMVRLIDNEKTISPMIYAQLKGKKKGSKKTEYKVYPYDSLEAEAGPIYLAPAGDNEKAIRKLEKKINALLKKLGSYLIEDDSLSSFVPGVYLGSRLGLPFTTGDPLLEKSYMVGVFSRVDSGFFNGLSWYWDLAPEVTAEQEGLPTKFSWSRATLGWSIGWNIYQGDSTSLSFDATPRLGLMDLDAQLVTSQGGEFAELQSFEVSNAESFGLEFGINYNTPWLLFRPWFSSDLAGLLTLGDNTTSISNQRLGLDSYLDLFTIGDRMRFSLFGFGVVERLLLEKTIDGEISIEANEIEALELFFIYAGGGVSVKW